MTSKPVPELSNATCAGTPACRSIATSSVALSLQSPYLFDSTTRGARGTIDDSPTSTPA